MNDLLSHVIFFAGSGLAFFTGVAFILAGLAVSPYVAGRKSSAVRNLAVFLGGVLVFISAAPLEWWLYALVATVSCCWLPLEWGKKALSRKTLVIARTAVAVVWLLALALEIPFHVTPSLPALGNPAFFVIGDSVSAGMSDSEKGNWPKILGRQHPVVVQDFSRVGATVKSARQQAENLGDQGGLVLLEIGGNDVLGVTTAAQFEEQLDLLLADVCRSDRTVLMLSLPLPPLANQFGLIQRRLARKYGVILIPQRVFVGLLTATGATVDGVHLTPVGHQRMADTMWGLVESAYK